MTRAARHLQEPWRDITDFPQRELVAGQTVYRSHAKENGPWWFASLPADEPGRFDLHSPAGTCYVGLDEGTAVLERFGPELHDQGWVFEESALGAAVTELELAEDVHAADTAHQRAASWITRELASIDDYELARRWAAKFFAAGFEGLHYQSRFTTGSDQCALALFGDAGTRPWPIGRTLDVVEMLEDADIQVVRPLPLRALTKATRDGGGEEAT